MRPEAARDTEEQREQPETAAVVQTPVAGSPTAMRMLASQTGNRALARAILARDDEEDRKRKEAEKYKGPTPETAFELTNEDKVRIEKLAVDQLRLMTTGTVLQAYNNFGLACLEAIKKIGDQEKAEAEARAKVIEFAFGAVGMLLGPAGKAAATAVPGPAIHAKLMEQVRTQLPGLELPPAVVKGALIPGRRIPSGLEDLLARETVTNLAAKLTPEAGEKLAEGAASKMAGVVKDIKVASPHQMAINFVHALQEAAHPSSSALRAAVAASQDAGALLAINAKFEGATPAVYRAEIDAKSQHFLEQVGRTQGGGQSVGIMNAYGKDRLFTYTTTTDDLVSGISYRFESWVTPDMQPMIFALNPNPARFEPSKLRGRIPEPTIEAADGKEGGTAIVKMNAYGAERLAEVKADVSWLGKTSYKFLQWIPPKERPAATARGAAQLNGIPQLDPAKVEGHIPEPAKETQ